MELKDKLTQLLEHCSPLICHIAKFHVIPEEILPKKIGYAVKTDTEGADKEGYLFTASGVYYPRFPDSPKDIDSSCILSAELRDKGKTATAI